MTHRVLTLVTFLGSCAAGMRMPAPLYARESFLPHERWAKTADPTARVFNGRLYVYTSWDDGTACGPKWSSPQKKEGSQRFCMIGYRAYSTADPTLRGGWVTHGSILVEEDVPWVYRGDPGWRTSARMWAPCVVQGDDRRFYLFFPAPVTKTKMAIGVAVSDSPGGPFIARRRPIDTPYEIDPSVVKLPNGRWVMFTSTSSNVWVQTIDKGFWKAGPRSAVGGLLRGYKEGPFAEIRGGNLWLRYAHDVSGYTIQQAVAKDSNSPWRGFTERGVAIGKLRWRTNHGSTVTFGGRSWAFYHRHMEQLNAYWKTRKVVYREVTFERDGEQNPIYPPTTL